MTRSNEAWISKIANNVADVCESREGGLLPDQLRHYLYTIGCCPVDCDTSVIGFVSNRVDGETIVARNAVYGSLTKSGFNPAFAFINTELCKTEREITEALVSCIGILELKHLADRRDDLSEDEKREECDLFEQCFFEKILKNTKRDMEVRNSDEQKGTQTKACCTRQTAD